MKIEKKEILDVIYAKYSTWLDGKTFACQKGCSSCCTQNVTITAVEGEKILDFIRQEKKEKWFAEQLTKERRPHKIAHTTNAFARLCLEKKEPQSGGETDESYDGICPFLFEHRCTIYPVRPFACRSFASTENCSENGAARLSEKIVTINTVTMQLIEHLGQREYWGNMIDVLLALSDVKENENIRKYIEDESQITQARARTMKAEPIAGFLLMPGEEIVVSPYLQSIFNKRVGDKTIEQIFNNQ